MPKQNEKKMIPLSTPCLARSTGTAERARWWSQMGSPPELGDEEENWPPCPVRIQSGVGGNGWASAAHVDRDPRAGWGGGASPLSVRNLRTSAHRGKRHRVMDGWLCLKSWDHPPPHGRTQERRAFSCCWFRHSAHHFRYGRRGRKSAHGGEDGGLQK